MCRSEIVEHFPLPTLEDIAPELAGSTLFSSLDAASGFWQVPLNKASRKLTTFITPFGRFMFKLLPFGISSASEIFQRKMADLLEDEEGIEVIIDDILIHGKDRAEHDARLNRAIHILNDAGVILNMSKCKFRVPSLIYFGHVVCEDRVEPHPDRVAAIMELPPSTNVAELKSVNGMFNYVAKFVPHLSTVMKPMTDLLKADAAWVWGPDGVNAPDFCYMRNYFTPGICSLIKTCDYYTIVVLVKTTVMEKFMSFPAKSTQWYYDLPTAKITSQLRVIGL